MAPNNYYGQQFEETITVPSDSNLFTEPIVEVSSLYNLSENEAKILLTPPNILKLAINLGVAVVGYSINEVVTEISKMLSSKPITDVLKDLYDKPFSPAIWKFILFSIITALVYFIGKFFPREYCKLVKEIKQHFKSKKPMKVLRTRK